MSATFLIVLLLAALGLAWAGAPASRAYVGAAITASAAFLSSFAPSFEWVLAFASFSALAVVLGCALAVFAPIERSRVLIYGSGLISGVLVGVIGGGSFSSASLAAAVPLLLYAAAQFLLRRKFSIALKVAASWMIAGALLNFAAFAAPPPPPAPSDHME